MFTFLVGFACGMLLGHALWGQGRSVEIRAVDQSGRVAGGDIVGGDKVAK